MNITEPPSRGDHPPSFLIGKNSRGNWVVQDPSGLGGGLFVNKAEALRYAMFEGCGHSQAVIMVPGVLELNMSAKPAAGVPRGIAAAPTSISRVA